MIRNIPVRWTTKHLQNVVSFKSTLGICLIKVNLIKKFQSHYEVPTSAVPEMASGRLQIGYRPRSDQLFRFSVEYELPVENTDRF
jgi:hypothetical protein